MDEAEKKFLNRGGFATDTNVGTKLGTDLAQLGTDCISRQSAIYAFNTNLNELVVGGEENAKTVENYLNRVLDKIKCLPSARPEIVRCKDCKHFEYDHVENINGIPLIVAHEICMRWSDGVKTSENGYCFLAERREVTT